MDLSLYFEAHEILSTSSQGLLSTSGQVRCITRQPPLLHAWCGSACAQYHQHEAMRLPEKILPRPFLHGEPSGDPLPTPLHTSITTCFQGSMGFIYHMNEKTLWDVLNQGTTTRLVTERRSTRHGRKLEINTYSHHASHSHIPPS